VTNLRTLFWCSHEVAVYTRVTSVIKGSEIDHSTYTTGLSANITLCTMQVAYVLCKVVEPKILFSLHIILNITVPTVLSKGIKRTGHEAVHSAPCGVEFKNARSYTTTPPIFLHAVVFKVA
jgi:hypothetical protein